MPLVHTRVFRVRHYECDAYGHVSNTNYVRYMQEAAFDASAAAGYDLDRYNAMGRYWLIRDTDISYLAPLTYGDSAEVTTWVVDFRKVRSRRAYEMRNAATGEMVARAITDWAFLDVQTGRPAAIPNEMFAAFHAGGPPDDIPAREKFVTPPPPPPGVYRMQRRVEWRDIDPMQHVNNATYLSYMDDAAFEASRARGWPAERLIEAGYGILVARHRIEYTLPAVINDDLEVATWVSHMRRASAKRHYTIRRLTDGEVISRATSDVVWVSLKTGRPAPILAQFTADFADHIVQV
jgi:acyl-CoA thioester hydrolase